MCKTSRETLISNKQYFIFSSYGTVFILVKAPCGLPSAALLTTTTCNRSRDSFDILSPSLWKSKSWENTQRKWATSCSEESNSTLFLQEKRQGQTAEFEINQTLALSTGATFRLWLRFDLGSSFQWVLTSQSCEESRAGSLQRGF